MEHRGGVVDSRPGAVELGVNLGVSCGVPAGMPNFIGYFQYTNHGLNGTMLKQGCRSGQLWGSPCGVVSVLSRLSTIVDLGFDAITAHKTGDRLRKLDSHTSSPGNGHRGG